MNEKEKKISSIIMLGFFIFIVVMYHQKNDNSLTKNKKYQIVEIVDCKIFGKNFTKYGFYFDGKYRNNTSNRLLYKNETDSIIGMKAWIEYDSLNSDNSQLIFGYQIPQDITPPKSGWKKIPDYFKKIYWKL